MKRHCHILYFWPYFAVIITVFIQFQSANYYSDQRNLQSRFMKGFNWWRVYLWRRFWLLDNKVPLGMQFIDIWYTAREKNSEEKNCSYWDMMNTTTAGVALSNIIYQHFTMWAIVCISIWLYQDCAMMILAGECHGASQLDRWGVSVTVALRSLLHNCTDTPCSVDL